MSDVIPRLIDSTDLLTCSSTSVLAVELSVGLLRWSVLEAFLPDPVFLVAEGALVRFFCACKYKARLGVSNIHFPVYSECDTCCIRTKIFTNEQAGSSYAVRWTGTQTSTKPELCSCKYRSSSCLQRYRCQSQ